MYVVLSPSRRVVVGCLQLFLVIIYLSFVAQVMAYEDSPSTSQPIAEIETAVSFPTTGIIANTMQNGTTGHPMPSSLTVNTLTLPVTLYDQTTDPNAVIIEHLNISLAFIDGEVQVHELYTFDYLETVVFTDSPNSTIAHALPATATDTTFQRNVGPASRYIPAPDIFQSGSHWYNTQPLRPGSTSATLLVSYRLPYIDALTLTHELPYDVKNVHFSLPYNGVTFAADDWHQLASRSTGADGSIIRNYSRDNFAAGDHLTLNLSGTTPLPEPMSISTNEAAWMFSVAVLLTAVTFIIRLIIIRRRAQSTEIEEAIKAEETPTDLTKRSRQLVMALTVLDEGYEKGWIGEDAYNHRRHAIKTELATIWEKLCQSGTSSNTPLSDLFQIPTPQPGG
ncbi:MAG: hypothetical protein DWQ04_26595 [Chloroflexi bacterium]|nr:MAG: hypothetical protein DWQ04_26595 [Chloroflexota bacterium]